MDAMAQIDPGLSKPLCITPFKNIMYKQKRCLANYRVPKCPNLDLQTIFWSDFYTIPIQKTLPRLPEPSELPENLEIKLKSIETLNKKKSIVASKKSPSDRA